MSDFDFIVVGAGSSGAIVASRLAAGGKFSVLLVEAGPRDTNPWIHVPIGFAKTIADKRVNWAYMTEPQAELHGRQIYWPRGKVVGGTGAINGLVYVRGQRSDFDEWANLGCHGWDWANVLPHFRAVEHHHLGRTELHGDDGPVWVSRPPGRSPLIEAVIDSGVAWGLRRNEDFNGETQEGVGYYDVTIRHGRRSNSAIGALPAMERQGNLRVEVNALVSRVLLEDGRATGVEYLRHDGSSARAHAKREVILCGGVVNTPQLLMLSGIGDGERLGKLGIRSVVDRPTVGQNLQDHMTVRVVTEINQPISLNDRLGSPWGKLLAGLEYVFLRTGPLTTSGSQAGIFFKSSDGSMHPDTQAFIAPYSAEKLGEPLHKFSAFSSIVTQSWPESRGYVSLRDADPRTPPEVQPQYLSASGDRSFFVNAVRQIRRLHQMEPLSSLIKHEHKPGKSVETDEEILDFIRRTAGTVYHPCGTCRMGSDAEAVVDPDLKVRGVKALRIADASVMPRIVSGNINAACLMIGEMAAQKILAATA